MRPSPSAAGLVMRWLSGCLGLLLVAGATAAPGADVQDMVGRHVMVLDSPRRVVSLAPSLTEIAYAVGAGDQLVGVTDYCEYPAEATTKPKVGGIATPNIEVILTLRPDLILATTEGNREADVRGLEDLHLPVYVVRPTNFVTVLDSIARIGRLLGRGATAERLVTAMRQDADTIARAVEGLRRPRVLYVLWGNPLIVPGRDTLITDVIRRAGGVSVTDSEGIPYPQFSWEEAVARWPERVILPRHGHTSVDAALREWPQLSLLAAVRQGQIYPIDEDLLHKSGPRIVDGLRALARLLHPELAW